MDLATVAGAKVIACGIVNDPWLDQVDLQEHRPQRLEVGGVGGYDTEILFFLIEGKGEITVSYDSLKGGKIATTFKLEEMAP